MSFQKEVKMTGASTMVEGTILCKKRNLSPCETPGCSENCAYAYSCHEHRMGRSSVFWPGVALILFVVVAVLV